MFTRQLKSVSQLLALACMVSIPLALCAQDASKPVAKYHAGDPASKWDIFAGYSYLQPNTTVTYPNPAYYLDDSDYPTASASADNINLGAILSGAYFFNRYVGVQLEGAYHNYDSNDSFVTGAGGVIVRDPMGRFTPFAHVLVGGARVHGNGTYVEYFTPGTWAGRLGGGGSLRRDRRRRRGLRVVPSLGDSARPGRL